MTKMSSEQNLSAISTLSMDGFLSIWYADAQS